MACHGSQDRRVPRYVCLLFRGRQVQHPGVKAALEIPSSSCSHPCETSRICLPFQGLLCPLESRPEAGR